MIKTIRRLLCCALAAGVFISTSAFAVSWRDPLSNATNGLSKQSFSSQNSPSLSSLTSLLNGSNQSLTSNSMNNTVGVLEYCAKQELALVIDAQNVKNQILDRLGSSAPERRQDTNYTDGIQGLLNTKDGQRLNLNTIDNSLLMKQVKTRACDLVLKQGMNSIS